MTCFQMVYASTMADRVQTVSTGDFNYKKVLLSIDQDTTPLPGGIFYYHHPKKGF